MYSILKHAYRENYTSTPTASNPIYTLDSNFDLTSSSGQLQTIFTSSSSSTITINTDAVTEQTSLINISFKVYNYSSFSIIYTVKITNSSVITVANGTSSINANSYDIWTFNGTKFVKTSQNNAIQ